MPKDPSPLLGYNNNIRHKDRVFHVQTEDSGVRHPHIITHLFMDGGRILKSVKTSYVDQLGAEKMADVVQRMMKDQHKAMLVALRAGEYDHIVEASPALKSAGAPMDRQEPKGAPSANKLPMATAPTELAMPASAPRAKSTRPAAKAPPEQDEPAAARTLLLPEELTLDIEALERAAVENSSPLFQPSDLPPPPANLFRERSTGGAYRSVTPPSLENNHSSLGRPPSSQGSKSTASRLGRGGSSRPPPPARRGVAPKPPSRIPARRSSPPSAGGSVLDGRHVPARPSATFGQGRPQRGSSIFGEDLISDKSLDEVILSYLAEDLETPSKKKK
jgi:hypothetical protein